MNILNVVKKRGKEQRCNCRKILGVLLCSVACLSAAYSQKTVSGKITDAGGSELPGVTVVVRGDRTTGTTTDVTGAYRIVVPSDNATLEFSYIGFKTRTETVGNRLVVDVTMEEELSQLDEVVVVGYGIQQRINMTGSVSQVNAKELLKAPMQNVSNMLTGKISGLTSIQSSGKPGADGTTLYVRGLNSYNGGNGPMVIVDGVPRTIDYLNPNDIESVSVLKDASASIYGVQGANGVILITTKSGSEGAAKISYDGSYTATQNTAMPEFLNAVDYMYWHNKAREMDGLTPLWTADIQNRVINNDPNSIWGQTNWLDKIFRTGTTQQHNISASGSTDKVKYYASIGLMDQEGTLKNTNLRRYNLRTNLDIQVAKNLKFTTNLAGYRADRHWPGTDISNQGEFNPVRQAITSLPIIKSDYEGLPTAWNGATYLVNGYAALNESGYKNQSRWHLDSNFKLEYDFSGLADVLKGLRVSIFAAYNYEQSADSNYDRYYELYYVNGNLDEGVAGASGYTPGNAYTKSSSYGDDWMLRPQVDYSHDFGKHFVGATLLFEERQGYSNTMTGTKRGFYSDDPVDISLGTVFPEIPVTGSYGYSGQKSYVGRANYSFARKYLAEFAFRYDGSFRFAPENRWGFFPSASVGWVLSEEDFFSKALPDVEYLKIRASYGQAGKDEVIVNGEARDFMYNSTYAMAANSMVLGGQSITQFYTTNAYVYRNLTWSTTHSYNLGFDLNMWRGKLGMELDLFYKLTTDILENVGANFPLSLGGYYPAIENSGKVENKGFELTLTHNNRINSDWSYGLKGNVSFARNKVLHRAMADNHPNYRPVVGSSMNARYGFRALGFFQTQEEIDSYPSAPSGNIRLGDLKYTDINGDGIINLQHDYVKIGYGGIPEINFSLNMDLSYRNFYTSLLWQGVSHADYVLSGVYDTGVISSTVYTSSFAEFGNSPYYRIEGAWTPENTNAKFPRLSTQANGNNAWESSWWLVNGEYMRLKNMNIGYNVPGKVLQKTPFSGISIYLAGTNLLTFSHFKYVDPESPSVSNGYYPQQKTYSVGVNITF
ncbi:MAG: TonB-dependent receptor [Tannerella sp.]|jgi:TonB-linked SusC/RagA family outer membrane protein|nr:TonB-dependent receptor [Tannerella sp.]